MVWPFAGGWVRNGMWRFCDRVAALYCTNGGRSTAAGRHYSTMHYFYSKLRCMQPSFLRLILLCTFVSLR